jgi:amidohydrolase
MADGPARLISEIEALLPSIIELSEFIHDHPELGYEEHLASARLSGMLEESGFVVERGLDDLATAFRARSGTPAAPRLAFIAEMDALPNLGHGCGHSMAGPTAVCAAIALLRAGLPDGSIEVIGTPAEEIAPPVKRRLVEHGIFDGLDAVMMVHAADRTAVGGITLAAQSMRFVFHGRSSHASSTPDQGISALDAAVLTMHALELLREHVASDTRIHGTVTDGGGAPNVVPARAELSYMIRTPRTEYLPELTTRVIACAEGAAHAVGATVDVVPMGTWDARYNVPLLNDLLLDNAIASGAFAAMDASERSGSTDYGTVTRHLPAATLKLPLVDVGVAGHSLAYVEAGKGPRANECIAIGAKALALTSFELLSRPELITEIHQQFAIGQTEAAAHE